uniref:Uncharacterized protein n=1 Tax=Arundo donax TaxID=35708 RepID=A0A0A8ZM20_ARUDO
MMSKQTNPTHLHFSISRNVVSTQHQATHTKCLFFLRIHMIELHDTIRYLLSENIMHYWKFMDHATINVALTNHTKIGKYQQSVKLW